MSSEARDQRWNLSVSAAESASAAGPAAEPAAEPAAPIGSDDAWANWASSYVSKLSEGIREGAGEDRRRGREWEGEARKAGGI